MNLNFLISSILNNDEFSENSKLFIDLSNKNVKKFKIIFILINLIYLVFSLIKNPISNNFYKIKLKEEIIKLEEYFKICNTDISFENKNKFKKIENPKISIISTNYKKGNFILRLIKSIQNQNFTEIEIIIIDDCSEDSTVKIIKNLQKEDGRILLIKHKKNKGTLISRNEGILFSKGKYLIIPDGDDILSKDIINQCFLIAEQKNYDFIRFNTYLGNKNIFMYNIIKYLINKEIYQMKLSSYIFYGRGYVDIIDPMISNKFIKRITIIKALNLIDKFYLNQKMIFYEDTLINYMLYKTANSFYHLKNLGYYYISNSNSSTCGYKKNIENINKLLNSFFLFLNFIFNYTKNNKYEKDMANSIIEKEMEIILTNNNIKKISKNFNFYENVIRLYIENKYILLLIKKRFNIINKLIKENKKIYLNNK